MKTNLLLFIDSSKLFWYLFWGDLKNSSIKSSALSLTIISMLSLFECVRHYSSLPLEELKLIDIAHANFQRIRFWRLFMMSFNMVWFYEYIILLIVFYFYHHYFHIQNKYYLQNYKLFLVCNNFLLHAQKDF